jgi:hypothetical protein
VYVCASTFVIPYIYLKNIQVRIGRWVFVKEIGDMGIGIIISRVSTKLFVEDNSLLAEFESL